MMKPFRISEFAYTNRNSRAIEQYLNEISKFRILTADEELELATKSIAGDLEARKKLIQHNLRFVVSVAKQFTSQDNLLGDLINEGNDGLIIAAERFDPTRGFKFISYAVWWIRQKILGYITSNRKVRIPQNKQTMLNKINRDIQQFEQKYERTPTNEELSIRLGIPEIDIKSLLEIVKPMSSLDDYIGNDNESFTIAETIADPDNHANTKEVVEDVRQLIDRILEELTPREKEILIRQFGLMGHNPISFNEIGAQLDISGERARQISYKAQNRLKNRLRNKRALKDLFYSL